MILAGYDQMNMAMQMSPREMKVVYHALAELVDNVDAQARIAGHMRAAGFKDYSSRDVFASLRQFQLAIGTISNGIHPDPSTAKEDEPEPEKKSTTRVM